MNGIPVIAPSLLQPMPPTKPPWNQGLSRIDLTRADIDQHVLRWDGSPLWYEREALLAYLAGWWQPILSRRGDHVYMLRFWLTPPELGADCQEGDFSFHDSLVLHQFLRPDDDAALHDHPAGFRATLLDGGYIEALPPDGWQCDILGPQYQAKTVRRTTGDTIVHAATDLHAVVAIIPGTWTLVRTGPRERAWGFHPPGQVWQPWRHYLNHGAA